MLSLAVFDVDGTLTDTNDVDDECFRCAVAETLAVSPASIDWTDAPHITDSALARWLCQSCCGREVTELELTSLVARFVDLLRQQADSEPKRFLPIRGARGLLDAVRGAGWRVALATGGWLPSARLKLQAAGLHEPDLIIASASDALTRAQIVQVACGRAAEQEGRRLERVTLVGDAPWDVRTAAELGYGFVGVGRRAAAMREAGASILLSDFSDHDALVNALELASIPAARPAA